MEEDRIRDELSDSDLEITKRRSFLFDNIDSFVALSRDNTSVEYVEFFRLITIREIMRFGIKWVTWWEISRSSTRSLFISTPTATAAALTGRYSLESCGIYGVRLRFVLWEIINQRVKKSKI
jgi:hypothetical protein